MPRTVLFSRLDEVYSFCCWRNVLLARLVGWFVPMVCSGSVLNQIINMLTHQVRRCCWVPGGQRRALRSAAPAGNPWLRVQSCTVVPNHVCHCCLANQSTLIMVFFVHSYCHCSNVVTMMIPLEFTRLYAPERTRLSIYNIFNSLFYPERLYLLNSTLLFFWHECRGDHQTVVFVLWRVRSLACVLG